MVTATAAFADRRTLLPSIGDQALVDEVMMSPVAALAAVLLRQLDPAAFDLVHGADVDTVGADYFHMFLDVGHVRIPYEPSQRTGSANVRPLSSTIAPMSGQPAAESTMMQHSERRSFQ